MVCHNDIGTTVEINQQRPRSSSWVFFLVTEPTPGRYVRAHVVPKIARARPSVLRTKPDRRGGMNEISDVRTVVRVCP